MTKQDFVELRDAAGMMSCLMAEGYHDQQAAMDEIIKYWVTRNCSVRPKDASIVIYTCKKQYGSHGHSDVRPGYGYFDFGEGWIETETDKAYIFTKDGYRVIIAKSDIIGWLS